MFSALIFLGYDVCYVLFENLLVLSCPCDNSLCCDLLLALRVTIRSKDKVCLGVANSYLSFHICFVLGRVVVCCRHVRVRDISMSSGLWHVFRGYVVGPLLRCFFILCFRWIRFFRWSLINRRLLLLLILLYRVVDDGFCGCWASARRYSFRYFLHFDRLLLLLDARLANILTIVLLTPISRSLLFLFHTGCRLCGISFIS